MALKSKSWLWWGRVAIIGILIVISTGVILPVAHAQQAAAVDEPTDFWGQLWLHGLDDYLAYFKQNADTVATTATGIIEAAAKSPVTNLMLKPIGWIIDIYSYVVEFIIRIGLNLLAPLITEGHFISHPFVREGWPFIQGIANLGFILVLLFIAFAQTLHLDNYPVRRLLPRLLVAAVLINFSLVISGIIIDSTRLMMAMMISILAGGGANNIQGELIDSSQLLALRVGISTQVAQNISLDTALIDIVGKLVTALLDTVFAIGIVVVLVGFFIRYIMLILLLIISPLAYLGFVLPNTANLAKKWWSLFLKYTLYGPVALFILLLAHQTGSLFNVPAPANFNGMQIVTQGLISLMVTVGMLFAAAKAGSFLGVAGSAAVMGFATTYGKKGARSYVSTIARPITKPISDFRKERGKQLERIQKQKPPSLGTRFARGVYDQPSAKSKNDIKEILGKTAAPGTISLSALRNKDAAKRLKKDQVKDLVNNAVAGKNTAQLTEMVNNIEMVRKMDTSVEAQITAMGDKDLIRDLNNMKRRIEDQDNKPSEPKKK